MRRRAMLILLVTLLFTGQAAAPTATLTPSQGAPGTTLDVTISAILSANGQVRFEPAGLIAVNLRYDARRYLQFTLQIPPTAKPGKYDLIYSGPPTALGGPPEQLRVPRAFTVTEPPRAAEPEPPVVRSIDPNDGLAGAPPFNVMIQGAHFAPGARLEIAGVQVLDVNVGRDGTSIRAQLSIPANAETAMSPVIVTNRDGSSNRRQQPEVKFRIRHAVTPLVRRIDPASATAGTQNLPVAITGANFAAGAKVSVPDGTIQFGAASVAGDSQINATISIVASAPAGPRPIIVTNPDGRSNASQSPPVAFTILPAPPPARQPPIGLPPPPPTSTQPPTAPPPTSTQPPPTPPPPTSTQPPVTGPPVSQPPATPPPIQPPVPTPPGVTPPPRTAPPPVTVAPKRPTERLEGPRIDLVTPQRLAAGATYDVQLIGKNLTPDIKLSFVSGIVVTKLRVTTPTTAMATLAVGPAVKNGTYAAQVTSRSGAGNGPGGIIVGATRATPATAAPVAGGLPLLPKYDQPYGDIALDKPCDVNAGALLDMAVRSTCSDVPMLTDELSFLWHELNPGIAKFFVFEIIDYDGKILFSAQTKQTWYRLTAANLASLPRIEVGPLSASAGNVTNTSVPTTQGMSGAKGPGAKADKPKTQSGAVNASSGGAHTQQGATTVPLAANLIKDGPTRSKKAGHHPSPGEVFWRVRGMSNKLHEQLGTPLPAMIESERSVERPILLPIPPNGFSCSNGTGNTKIAFLPRYQPQIPPPLGGQSAKKPPRPKPCEGMSTHICSPVDLVEFTNDSHINLSRIPFDLQQTGSFGGPFVRFDNVWIDWGDGSEPQPLVVKGNLAKYSQSLKSVRFFAPGSDENARIAHRYVNEDKKAELVRYTIRIYALADADATPPSQWAESSAGEAQSMGSVVNAAYGGTPSPANATASASNASNTSGATQASASAMAAATGVFTIACEKVEVRNVWEVGYDDPLHLLTAKVVFSTEMAPANVKTPAESAAKTAYQGAAPGGTKTDAYTVPKNAAAPASGGAKGTARKSDTSAAGVAPTYAGGDPTIPEVSDCSTVFKAAARITYYGHGKVALDWYLDDFHIETTVVTSELPAVSLADGEAGTKHVLIWMKSALPPALHVAPHRVKVIARVVFKKKYNEADYGLGPTQTPKKKNPYTDAGSTGPNGETFAEEPQEEEPGRTAESEVRKYHVFNHKVKGLPCTLRYATAETGAFDITDITSFERNATGANVTFSGNGFLNIVLPSANGTSTAASQGIPIVFKQWTLEPAEDDYFDVKAGQYEKTLNYPLDALTFPFRVTKISMTLQRVALSGNVAADEGKGFITAAKGPAVWEFENAPITADGGFYYESPKKIEALLGASGFAMDISKAAIDFSLTAGAAPVKACTTTAGAEKWQGIALDGTLTPPDNVALNDVPLLKDYKFEKWGIAPNGLSVAFDDDKYVLSLSQSGVKVTVRGLKFSFCSGDLGSTQFGLDIENAPLIVQKLSGKLTMDAQAQLLPEFTLPQAIEHDWGNVRAKITDAQFVMNPHAASYGLSLKSHVWFKALGKPAFDHAYDGLFVTLAGNVFNAEAKHYWGVPGAAVADMGGFPVTVTQLGVGNESNGDLWFGFIGDIEAGDNAPQAPNKEAKFVLKSSASAALRNREPWQLASLDLVAAESMDLDGEGYTAGDESLQVESFSLNWAFPAGSGTVELVAECIWASAPNRYFMWGKGEVIVLDSFTAGAEVLFGQESGESYWVLKGHYALPTMIPLGSTPFGLARFDGGLSYNVPISAFDANDLKTVKKDGEKALGVYGAVDVGTKADDGFMLYGRGGLTIRIADDWGLRMSIKVWLVTSDHESAPSGEACVQYAGGAFDAGATAHISTAGGILVVEAPQSGGDVCTQSAIHAHFGGGDDWFINVGTESAKLSVYFLWTNAEGYMTMNSSGVIAYAGVHVQKKWGFSSSICDGSVGINAGLGGEGKLQTSPFYIQATVSGYASLYAKACGVGTSFGASVKFTGGAPPLKLCGSVKVKVDLALDDISMSINRCLF